jgi:hypothetical protein
VSYANLTRTTDRQSLFAAPNFAKLNTIPNIFFFWLFYALVHEKQLNRILQGLCFTVRGLKKAMPV